MLKRKIMFDIKLIDVEKNEITEKKKKIDWFPEI